MPVTIKPVNTKNDLKHYIHFPFVLYKHDPYWVPPLLSDEYAFYNAKKNSNLASNPYKLWLAYKDQQLAGRIMGLINQKANNFRNEKLVRWTFLDAVDDQEVVHALLREVEGWGKAQGMEFAVGPRGFSDEEPQGALIEGYNERALIGTHYNRPYLLHHLERHGYTKDMDWVCYRIDVFDEFPESYQAIYQRLIKKQRFTCRNLTSKAEVKAYIFPLLALLNETYRDMYGFCPLNEKEFHILAQKYVPLLDPRFVCILEDGDKFIGFLLAMPDITEGLQKARGRLFPFGIFHLLRARKRSNILQVLLVGILEHHRNQGLFALLAVELLKQIHAAGMSAVYGHLQLENNDNINTWVKRLGGKIFRRYRAFIKPLL